MRYPGTSEGRTGAPIARAAAQQVKDALADTRVVLIHGPRQAGKTTLAETVADELGNFEAISLDDPITRSYALERPAEFVADLQGPTLIDEIQRAPDIFLSIKASVDRDKRPGRFLLTGSSNILALPKLADSLAGRMAIIDLLPLAQAEVEGREPGFVDAIFGEGPLPMQIRPLDGGAERFERILRGGFPEARSRGAGPRRDAWFADYVRTLLERDVRDMANVEAFSQLPRLLARLAARTGESLNVSGISRDIGIPNTSLHRYLDLLRGVFLVHDVPAWSSDLGTRLAKAPKLYMVDSGLLAYLLNANAESLVRDRDQFESVLESFVAMELKKLANVSSKRPGVYHLRTVKQLEVDFVLEARGGDLVGIEVSTAKALEPSDADGLKFLRDLAPDKFRRGLILYAGDRVQPVAKDIVALPLDALWRL